MTADEFNEMLSPDAGTLTEIRLRFLDNVAVMRRQVEGSYGQPACIQKLADQALINAVASAEEFGAFDLEEI